MELLLHSRLQDRVIEKLIRPPPVGTLCGRALLSFALRAFLSFAFCEFGADGFSCQELPLPPTTMKLCTAICYDAAYLYCHPFQSIDFPQRHFFIHEILA